jgi:hypothetical protein
MLRTAQRHLMTCTPLALSTGGSLYFIRRYHIPALFCALAVLLCELISRPYVNMGICDDWPYILMARTLATTGHIVYNGWAAPMLGWQLYLGAVFIKLFGFSFTAVRMSTLLVAMAMAFVLQRILVRANISERNATLGTLAFVVSPLYLMLSVTYMTDIFGLFAIVTCLYGCLRALQSRTDRSSIAWLCFAVASNALCGTSRQIAWLGILVMVPSTLWLLRAQRRILLAGATANLAGVLFIFACIEWLKHQPYTIPEHLLPPTFPITYTVAQLFHLFLDAPFLILPIAAIFLPEIRKSGRRIAAIFSASFFAYLFLAILTRHDHRSFRLEPTQGDWITVYGLSDIVSSLGGGHPPIYIHSPTQVLLTIASLGGLLGLIASLLRTRRIALAMDTHPAISWKQLGILLAPFSFANTLLLIPRATTADGVYDRYLLGLLVVALLCLVRYYQEQIHPRLPIATAFLIAFMAVYGIAITHYMFSFYRARVALAAELRAHGVPDTSVDSGWEYNLGVELQHAPSINFPSIAIPAHAYVPTPPLPAGTCPMYFSDYTPHIHPLYTVSFTPDACHGLAPFAPALYSRWPYRTPGTLYIVHSTPSAKP